MALAILIIGSFLFYSTSKYFPNHGFKWLVENKKMTLFIAGSLVLSAFIVFSLTYDLATAFVFWSIAFMTLLSAMIISIKLNFKWIWAWVGLFLIFVLIDIV